MSSQQVESSSKSSPRQAAAEAVAPLRRLLTRDALYETAGPRTYKRGETCLAQHRVTSFEALPDALHGQVLNRHGEPYSVVISTDAEGFFCECQCPAFDN